jgi:aspartyl-tRNA(Asn)/glutamyl-tRNA(Gln) amidotransferase subunit A
MPTRDSSLSRRETVALLLAASAAAQTPSPSLSSSSRNDVPTDWTLTHASEQIRRGKISPVELTRVCLERIEKLNPVINAFITVMAEQALAQARD